MSRYTIPLLTSTPPANQSDYQREFYSVMEKGEGQSDLAHAHWAKDKSVVQANKRCKPGE